MPCCTFGKHTLYLGFLVNSKSAAQVSAVHTNAHTYFLLYTSLKLAKLCPSLSLSPSPILDTLLPKIQPETSARFGTKVLNKFQSRPDSGAI